MSYIQATRPECKTESYYNTVYRKNGCFSVDGFCKQNNTVFEAMECYLRFCICQKARINLTDDDIKRVTKKREKGELRKHYAREKGHCREKMFNLFILQTAVCHVENVGAVLWLFR